MPSLVHTDEILLTLWQTHTAYTWVHFKGLLLWDLVNESGLRKRGVKSANHDVNSPIFGISTLLNRANYSMAAINHT